MAMAYGSAPSTSNTTATFSWGVSATLVTTAISLRVAAAFRPAARRLRVVDALRPAALRFRVVDAAFLPARSLRVRSAFLAAAFRFLDLAIASVSCLVATIGSLSGEVRGVLFVLADVFDELRVWQQSEPDRLRGPCV